MSAVFFPPDVLVVTFDEALVPGVLNLANWSARIGGQRYTMGQAAAAGADVNLFLLLGPPEPGPNVVDYAAAPPDVVSLATGIPAAAFTDFPVT